MNFISCKLKDILIDIHSGGTPSTTVKEYWGGPYKWLSSGETGQRFISDTIETITDRGIRESSTKLAKRGSVVMACAGQGKTRGQTSYLLDDMYVNQSVIVLNPDTKKVCPLYLFYDLSRRYEELRGGSDASSTRGSITTASLKGLSFQYPVLEKQRKIVSILYAYDQLIEVNNKRIKVLEQMAENLYKEWFVRFRFPGYETVPFEDGLPHGWAMRKLEELSDFSYGKMPEKHLVSEIGYPIFTGYQISGYYKEYSFPKEKLILIARGVGGTGEVRLAPAFSFITNLSIIINLRNPELHKLYLYYRFMLKNLRYLDTGAAQSQITIENLKRVRVMIPINSVLLAFNKRISKILDLIEKLNMQNDLLIKERDMLLPRMMSGKLEV